MFDSILLLIAVNLALFTRTLKYGYAVDDWENARCSCKNPDFAKAQTLRHGKMAEVSICKKCGILEGVVPKNLWQKFLWSFGGLVWIGDKKESPTTTQYADRLFDHSLTLIIHILNCLLIYFAFGKSNISFITALLFAVHPVAMQGSSVWLSGKGYAVGLMFSLLAYWIVPLAPLFYAIGSWYVSVLVLPMIFLHTPYWYLIFLLPIVVWFRKKKLHAAIDFKYSMVKITRDPFHWHNIILVFKTIGYYFSLAVFPIRLGVHPEYLAMYGVTDEDTKECLSVKDWFFWLGIALTLATAYLFFWHYGPVAQGLFWFFVFIAPWSNWMAAVHQPIGERYAIIALVGVLYALGSIIAAYPVVYMAFLVYYATITYMFTPAYNHILTFAVYNVLNFPRSFQGWLWKSDIERNFRLLERSFDSAMQAWCIRPDDFLVNNNITTLLLMQHRHKDAEVFLQRMEKCPMPSKDMEGKRDLKVKAIRDQMKLEVENLKTQFNQGRNAPCKCGSGKKSKHCCGA